jgi:receptor expression-enhancing protein 5/6
MLSGYFRIGQLLANFAALVVPGYYSLLALESRNTNDDVHYLTYWVVYAFFSVIEFWSKQILYWIPFYWLFKTIFFLYIGLPHMNGSRVIYQNFIRPMSLYVINGRGSSSASLREKLSSAASMADDSHSVRSTGSSLHTIHT